MYMYTGNKWIRMSFKNQSGTKSGSVAPAAEWKVDFMQPSRSIWQLVDATTGAASPHLQDVCICDSSLSTFHVLQAASMTMTEKEPQSFTTVP